MTETKLPKSSDELMADIEREWNLLLAVVDRLSPEQMTTPDDGGWTPKDNLAHLGEWMNVLMGYHLDQRPAHEVLGVTPEITEGWDMEVINPVLFERNLERSTAEVLTELRSVYNELVTKLSSMPFEDLMKPRHADDPEKRPLLLWVLGDTTEHFEEHRETIEKMLL
jgi:hypothetical protein